MKFPSLSDAIFFSQKLSSQERRWCEDHQSLLCHRFVAELLKREPTEAEMLSGLYLRLGHGNKFSPFRIDGRQYPLCFVYGDDLLIWGFFRNANREIICEWHSTKIANCDDVSFRKFLEAQRLPPLPRP